MEDIIILRQKGNQFCILKKLQKPNQTESKTFKLKTDSPNLRSGEQENGKKYIDPIGGPVIAEGVYLEKADAVVKSIDFVMGYGCTITFE